MSEQTPFWKKEISLGKKAKPAAPAEAAETAEKPTPFYKKEVSLPRRSAQPDAAGAAKTPFWKKEISLGKKAKAGDAPVVAADSDVAEPLATEPVVAVEPVVAPEPVAPAAPEPVAVEPVAPEPVAPVAVEPVVPAPVAVEPALEPLPEIPPAIAAVMGQQPVEAPAPIPAAPALDDTLVAPAPPVETWEQATALPAEPVAPAPVVIHPPVPAAELPPIEDDAPKSVPFWKKDVTIGKPRAPKAEKQPKEPKQKREKAPGAVPFWKREVTIGKPRTPKVAADVTVAVPAPPVPAVAAAPAVPEPKVPFWKKELGGKSKGDKPARSEKRGKPAKTERAKSAKGAKGAKVRGAKKGGGKGVKRLVGLKIGASQIAAARVANNGHAELLQVARQPLASGVVVSGELRDPDALAEALKEFFKRNKLPKKNVRLGIASNRIGVRTFDLEGVSDEKQLNNAIQFRAQETLPIPIEEAVLDYQVLSEAVLDNGDPMRRVLLVVAYRELVDRYVVACRKAGITLVGIDLEAFALLRALGAPQAVDAQPDAALVAVAIGHDRSTFAVSDGRVCEFTRVLDWGGSAINVAIARALDLAPSEVEGVKRAMSLDGGPVPEGLAPEHAAAALDATRKQLQAFARELVSSLQFYQNQPGSLGIGEIVVTGGTAHLPGLAAELQRLIGVQVRVGDPLGRVKVAKKMADPDQLGSLAVAIGLGIED